MRKALLLLTVLAVCGAAGIFPLRSYVLAQKDQVSFTEETIFGDSSIVEGVTVKLGSHLGSQLYWDSVYRIGEQPVTEYKYYGTRHYETVRKETHSGVYMAGFPNFGSSGTSVESVGRSTGFAEAYQELEEKTGAGLYGTKRIFVRDYYTYYPVWLAVDTEYFSHDYSDVFWAGSGDYVPEEEREGVLAAFGEFFQIPVLEEETYVIELRKDIDGRVVEINGTPGDLYAEDTPDSFYWETATVWDEGHCYFTFVPYSRAGKEMDTSRIPGGFGIYCLPFYQDAQGVYHVKAEELKMVYALEPEEVRRELSMEINAAGELLLITGGEEQVYFTVLDTESFALRQKLSMERPDEEHMTVLYREDDFMVYSFGSRRLTVVDWNQERGYEQQFVISLAADDLLLRSTGIQGAKAFDWDGERLIFVTQNAGSWWQYDLCDFMLAVYGETGLLYQGRYLSSLHAEKERREEYVNLLYKCEARQSALAVEWGK